MVNAVFRLIEEWNAVGEVWFTDKLAKRTRVVGTIVEGNPPVT